MAKRSHLIQRTIFRYFFNTFVTVGRVDFLAVIFYYYYDLQAQHRRTTLCEYQSRQGQRVL